MSATEGEAPTTVAGAFVHALERFSERIALVTADGRRISYAELGGEVRRAVSVLRSLGCRPGDRVAIWLPNRPEWPILEYAAALLGLLIVPVNARYRAGEAEYVLRKSGAVILFTQGEFLTNDYLARLREIAGGPLGEGDHARIEALPALERIVLIDTGARQGALEGAVAFEDLARGLDPPDDLAELARGRRAEDWLWMFWTSGTTSAPKGAIIDQGAITNVWNWTSRAGYRGDDRILATFPLFYIAGNFWCLLAPMLRGATLVLGQEFSAAEIVTLCRRERITILAGIPLLLKNLVNDPRFDPGAFEHVRFGWFGGATISEDDLRRIKERIGYEHLVQVYGMTELQGFTMSTDPDDPIETTYRTVGRPLPGFEVELVQPGTTEPVRHGEPGELIVRGRRFVDYEGVGEADRASFFDAAGWYHTGDLLRQREDGRYVFAGRAKDLIKVGGENVSASEIEVVIMSHPKVLNVAVTAVPDEERGETPAAFIEFEDGHTMDPAEFRDWCRTKLAPFKVPRRVTFLEKNDWPRTSSGKIAKWQLKSN